MANVAVHTISFRGTAGGIFISLVVALVLYVIGFATPAWRISGSAHLGLWESCNCQTHGDSLPDWFHAVQAMITIGLILLAIALILACIYMCIHSVSKNSTILGLVIVCFLAVLFMLIGFIIWGVKETDHNWSFVLTVIAAIFTLIAGILSVVQLRASGVQM